MEARTFKEYKRVTVFRVLRYDNYVWQTEAHFQDMKALVGLGGFLPIDREHILAMKEIRRKNCHEWVLLIYLCMVAFHSPTEVEFPDGRLRLEKGQVKVDVDHLAAFISKDKSAVIVLLKTLARKKLISLK